MIYFALQFRMNYKAAETNDAVAERRANASAQVLLPWLRRIQYATINRNNQTILSHLRDSQLEVFLLDRWAEWKTAESSLVVHDGIFPKGEKRGMKVPVDGRSGISPHKDRDPLSMTWEHDAINK